MRDHFFQRTFLFRYIIGSVTCVDFFFLEQNNQIKHIAHITTLNAKPFSYFNCLIELYYEVKCC